MPFEKKELWVIVALDPTQGACSTELVHDYEEEDDLDQIYKITAHDEDWINPIVYGLIKWDRDSSCTLDSNEEIDHWHNRLHEDSMLRCNMMTKLLRYNMMTKSPHCVPTEVQNLPHYDGLSDVNFFWISLKRRC